MGQEMEAPGKYWAMQFFPQESNQLPSPPSGSQSIFASRGTCSAVPILLSFCSFLHKERFLPFSFCSLILSPMWESRWRWERCGVGIPHFCSKIHGRNYILLKFFFQLWQHDVFDWCQIMVEVRFEMKLSGFFYFKSLLNVFQMILWNFPDVAETECRTMACLAVSFCFPVIPHPDFVCDGILVVFETGASNTSSV